MIIGPHAFAYFPGTSGSTQSYKDVVLADGPVAYWRLDETSGSTAADETGNGNTGTYVNSPDLDQLPAVPSGRSVLLNASGTDEEEHISFGSAWPFDQWSGMTIEQWVRWTGGTSGNDPRLMSRNNGGTRFRWQGRSNLEWQLGGVATLSVSYSFPDDAWVHVVGTWNGSNLVLYVNASSLGSKSVSGTPVDNGETLHFGWEDGGILNPDRWQGYVDEIAIYDRALSAAEIQEHYNAGTS